MLSGARPHLGAALDTGDDGFQDGHEGHVAERRGARDGSEGIERGGGRVRVQACDGDQRAHRAPAVRRADEGRAARHQRQHLHAHSTSRAVINECLSKGLESCAIRHREIIVGPFKGLDICKVLNSK